MTTFSSCPRCRTVALPGQDNCLRCGQPIEAVARDCPACGRRLGERDRFCPWCGQPAVALDAAPEAEATAGPVDTDGVFLADQSRRRPVLIGLAVFGAVLTIWGTLAVVDWYAFRPERTVQAYFAALADRDAGAAQKQLSRAGGADEPLLASDVLRADGYTPPADVRVGDLQLAADRTTATAEVSYALAGQRRTGTLQLRRDEQSVAGAFHRWQIVGGVNALAVSVSGVDNVLIAGRAVPLAEGSSGIVLTALPGGYTVALPEQPLLTAAESRAYVDVSGVDQPPVELQPTVRPDAEQEVARQVRTRLDACAKSTSLQPPNCPFGSYVYGTARHVRWKILRYPKLALELSDFSPGAVNVRTVEPGQAEVTGEQVSAFLGTTSVRDTVSIQVTGAAAVTDGRVTWVTEDLD